MLLNPCQCTIESLCITALSKGFCERVKQERSSKGGRSEGWIERNPRQPVGEMKSRDCFRNANSCCIFFHLCAWCSLCLSDREDLRHGVGYQERNKQLKLKNETRPVPTVCTKRFITCDCKWHEEDLLQFLHVRFLLSVLCVDIAGLV